VLASDPK